MATLVYASVNGAFANHRASCLLLDVGVSAKAKLRGTPRPYHADERIKSDTPRVDLPLPTAPPLRKNIGFHYVWTVAYPLTIDRRGHESKALLAHHG